MIAMAQSKYEFTVYGDADLKRRIKAAKKNPDLHVTYRRIG